MMSSTRVRRASAGYALLAGIAAAGFLTAPTAHADPLWPGGPDVPGVPAIVPPPPAPPVIAPCTAAGAKVCMSKSMNEAWLMEDGKVTYGPTPISHGRPGYETPPGVFKVAFKREDHWSTMHHVPMKWAVFFNGDIATHIGPVEEQSHGCIRMVPEGAERLYHHVNPGDIIEVIE